MFFQKLFLPSNNKTTNMSNEEILSNIPEIVNIKAERSTSRVWVQGTELKPERSQKIINHSPDGFSWGYNGSGCAQLALAILLVYLPEYLAKRYYQGFKSMFVACWNVEKDVDQDINIRLFVSENFSQENNGNL